MKIWQILIKKTILFKLYFGFTLLANIANMKALYLKKKKNPNKVIVVVSNTKDAIETFINYIRTYYFYENLLKEFLDFAITR